MRNRLGLFQFCHRYEIHATLDRTFRRWFGAFLFTISLSLSQTHRARGPCPPLKRGATAFLHVWPGFFRRGNRRKRRKDDNFGSAAITKADPFFGLRIIHSSRSSIRERESRCGLAPFFRPKNGRYKVANTVLPFRLPHRK